MIPCPALFFIFGQRPIFMFGAVNHPTLSLRKLQAGRRANRFAAAERFSPFRKQLTWLFGIIDLLAETEVRRMAAKRKSSKVGGPNETALPKVRSNPYPWSEWLKGPVDGVDVTLRQGMDYLVPSYSMAQQVRNRLRLSKDPRRVHVEIGDSWVRVVLHPKGGDDGLFS